MYTTLIRAILIINSATENNSSIILRTSAGHKTLVIVDLFTFAREIEAISKYILNLKLFFVPIKNALYF